MAFCRHCGHALAAGDSFCSGCGKAVDGSSTDEGRKSTYDGEIHKCPSCGVTLDSFVTKCPDCGYELRGVSATSSVKELSEKLDEIEALRGTITDDAILEKKISAIENFPIPNTKEDIFEFIVLAAANIDLKEKDFAKNKLMLAWKKKFEQAYYKARISFSDDSDFYKIEHLYKQEIVKPKRYKIIKRLIIVGIIVLWVAASYIIPMITLSNLEDDYKDDIETIVWNNFVLGDNIPDFGRTEAEVVWDTENVLILYFYDVESSKFDEYINECKNWGYDIDIEDNGANFTAYNSEGYYLRLQYLDWDNKKLTIDLEDPKDKDTIIWPSSELVKDVPIPRYLIGEVSTENETSFGVYIVEVEQTYFQEYVALCMENGFNIDYSKSKTYFTAKNMSGISITIEYEGFNTLYIWVRE